MKMATTFKVVEFYRSNNTTSSNLNDSLNVSSSNDLNNGNTSLSESNANKNGMNPLYNSLGFNVLGGYLTSFPATIVNLSSNINAKLNKVSF